MRQNFGQELHFHQLTDKLPDNIQDSRFHQQIQKFINERYNDDRLEQLVQLVQSSEVMDVHRGTIGIRKLISTPRQIYHICQLLLERNLITKFIQFAKNNQYPQLQLQSLRILVNLCSTTHDICSKFIESNRLDLFVQSLKHENVSIFTEALWGTGNLAGDCVQFRNMFIQKGVVQIILKRLYGTKIRAVLQTGLWVISNLYRGNPKPDPELFKNACGLICQYLVQNPLKQMKDKNILEDLIWCLSFMSEQKLLSKIICEYKIIGQIVSFASEQNLLVIGGRLRIVGNLVVHGNLEKNEIIKNNIFSTAQKMLNSPKKTIRVEICSLLQILFRNFQFDISTLTEHRQFLNKISYIFQNDAIQIKRKICWIYAHMRNTNNKSKIVQLYRHYNVMAEYVNLLNKDEDNTILDALKSLYYVILVGQQCAGIYANLMREQFLQNDGLNILQKLEMHRNGNIYKAVLKLKTIL